MYYHLRNHCTHQGQFSGKLSIHHISMPLALFSKFSLSIFLGICFFRFRHNPIIRNRAKISKWSTVFIWFPPHFITNMLVMEEYSSFHFGQSFTVLWHFFLTGDHIWDWKCQNAAPPTVFIQSQPNIIRAVCVCVCGGGGGYKAVAFLSHRTSFTKLIALWNVTMRANGKS